MAIEPRPMAGLMDTNVPSQLDEADLAAEIEVELPGSMDNDVIEMISQDTPEEIEIYEDGEDTIVDFEPDDMRGESDDFFENLAEELPARELGFISGQLLDEYEGNRASRQEWEDAYADGLELLGFSYEERTQPFRGASGVTHPLLAESATQFQAQAFNEMLPSSGPVRSAILGSETTEKEKQAGRVQQFMNYYITNVMEEYTPEFDQMMFYLPLAGSTFKKVYYDEMLGRAVSRFIPAENLIVPYNTSDLETCPNISQVVKMSLNDLRKLQVSGFYRDIPVVPGEPEENSVQNEIDRIDGTSPSQTDYDCTLLESHVDLDLDGYEDLDEDGEPTGIKLPYIVTLSMDNGQVLSIRRNFREEDELRKKIQYFVHYKFLPGFGFYGLGLIHTIGGLSRTATSALRQLIDAGTLSNLPAGFKARGMRIRDDDDPLQPGEFRDVDAPGGRLSDSLMALPFKGPDQTLFALLGFVVDAGRRFSTITDMKVGDGNQQAAVGTTVALLEQGSRVMSAVHKRMHYAMRQELKLLASVVSEYLPQEYPYTVEGADSSIMAKDFDDRVDVVPVSDPNVFSQAQRIALAQAKLQLAQSAPEMHNMYEVLRGMYDALGVRDTDKILRRTTDEEPVPLDPAQENINALDMIPLKAFEGQDHQAHIMAHMVFGSTPLVGSSPTIAVSLQKHIMEHVRLEASEAALVQYLQQVGARQGQPLSEEEMLQVEALTAQLIAQGMQMLKQLSQKVSGGDAPDPVVQLKEQELQIKAKAEENDAAVDQAKLALDQQSLQVRNQQFNQRLQSQEAQTQARIRAAMDREYLKQQTKRNQ